MSQVPDLNGRVWLYECPYQFIPVSVKQFVKRWDHMQKYPHTMPAWDDMSPRFRAFVEYFEACERNNKAMSRWGTP